MKIDDNIEPNKYLCTNCNNKSIVEVSMKWVHVMLCHDCREELIKLLSRR